MRKRVVIFCAVILAVCVWLLWSTSRHGIEPQNAPTEVASPAIQQAQTQITGIHPVFVTTNSSLNTAPPATNAWVRGRQPLTPEEIYHAYDPWRTPINFYGMVVDESNNPVAGADITFDCNDLSEKGTSYYSRKSDQNGIFSLTDVTGEGITVHISKDGYYTSRRDKDNFEYALNHGDIFVPSAGTHVVFHLRKKRQREYVITSDFPGFAHIAQLHHDGTPIELNLLNGTQAPAGSGQLKLELWRDVSDMNKQPFDWKLQLSAPGGGLVPTDEEFAFLAPENGYQPSIVIDMPATNQIWQGELRTKYYIQLPNGNYGLIDFYLLPYNGAFTVHSIINPSSSRNLEPQ